MKKVHLKTTRADNTDLVYKDQIIVALSSPANPQGMDYDEMSKVIPVIDKIKAAEGFVLLEDSEFELVAAAIKRARYSMAHPALLQMMEDIIASEEAMVREVTDAVTG